MSSRPILSSPIPSGATPSGATPAERYGLVLEEDPPFDIAASAAEADGASREEAAWDDPDAVFAAAVVFACLAAFTTAASVITRWLLGG